MCFGPAVRSYFGPLLTGPADILQDLTFGEFRHASAALSSFFKSKDIRDLDECIAHLYRRRCCKPNRAGRKVAPVSQDKFESDVKLVSKLPVWQKSLIMAFFANCINYLQKGKLIIGGEEIDFSLLYAGSDSLSAVVFVLDSRTGNLRRSRSTRASSDRLVFEHPIYERYLDMKRMSGKKRKSRKIHNRYVFGAFSSIAERLMYGFTDEVAAQFREMSDKLGD